MAPVRKAVQAQRVLRRAWLSLLDEHTTTGRINQIGQTDDWKSVFAAVAPDRRPRGVDRDDGLRGSGDLAAPRASGCAARTPTANAPRAALTAVAADRERLRHSVRVRASASPYAHGPCGQPRQRRAPKPPPPALCRRPTAIGDGLPAAGRRAVVRRRATASGAAGRRAPLRRRSRRAVLLLTPGGAVCNAVRDGRPPGGDLAAQVSPKNLRAQCGRALRTCAVARPGCRARCAIGRTRACNWTRGPIRLATACLRARFTRRPARRRLHVDEGCLCVCVRASPFGHSVSGA